MEPSASRSAAVARWYLVMGLLLLAGCVLFGLLGAAQYLVPGLWKAQLSFEKVKPLHVSSAIFWILSGAMGVVYGYTIQHARRPVYSLRLQIIQLVLFATTVLLVLLGYVAGIFGGRQFWEFDPALAVLIAASWVLFIVNYVKTVGSFRNQPVHVWMWSTGIFFFLFAYAESYLWLLPFFHDRVAQDMTIQWKSYGSMIGAWNMLVYGSGIYLMDKIAGGATYSRSGTAFALYFLGLFNLMFNWGHHIYTLPTHDYVKDVSYAVSMTELILLARIIYLWKASLDAAGKHAHLTAYRFMMASDRWVLLTLVLAIAMSVPAVNVYTHGTQVTVAHTMGATIGIDTFLLLACVVDLFNDAHPATAATGRWLRRGLWIANNSLLVFWLGFIGAGIWRAGWQMSAQRIPFADMMQQSRPWFVAFSLAGFALGIGLMMIAALLLKDRLGLRCLTRRSGQKSPADRARPRC